MLKVKKKLGGNKILKKKKLLGWYNSTRKLVLGKSLPVRGNPAQTFLNRSLRGNYASFILGHAPQHRENNFSAGGRQVRLPKSCLMACGKTLVRYIDMFKNCSMSVLFTNCKFKKKKKAQLFSSKCQERVDKFIVKKQ